jgi:hypothetical protein
MSYGAENARDELNLTGERRDDYIEDLTGIRPDIRYFVPAAEKEEMIKGVQAGDAEAAERLVATRLHWLYHLYADRLAPLHPRVAGVRPQDFFHIGGMAVIRAAEHISSDTGDPVSILHSRTPDWMQRAFDDGRALFEPPQPFIELMNRGKLLPAVAPDGSVPLYTAAQEAEDTRIPEQIELTGASVPEVPDFDPGTDILFMEAVRKAFDRLDERRRFVAESWFGLDRPEQKLEEIGRQLDITKSRAAQLKDEAVKKLRANPLIRRIGIELDYAEPEEPEEPAEVQAPLWEPENNPLQQAWLDEIREKQERGEIAFVRGSLLTRSLPEEVETYLFWTQLGLSLYDNHAKWLKKAIQRGSPGQ